VRVKGSKEDGLMDGLVDGLADALRSTLGPTAVRVKEPLARYTSLRIGGPADLVAVVETAEMLGRAVTLAWEWEVPYRVLGSGSNVLVSDDGVGGLVVLNRARAVTFVQPSGVSQGQGGSASVRAESGASLSTVARRAVARGLSGLEWAVGIPGTIGGAVVGNAGAWGGDMASTLIEARILEPGGAESDWSVKRFEYEYRSSALKQQSLQAGVQAVVLEAELGLQAGERETLEARVAKITARRKESQPAGATCGSIFKNPPGDYAGRLIEAVKLKGQRCGGAEITQVHANFVVNRGQATAADVKALIDQARQAVQSEFGVALKLEIELIGRWQGSHAATAVQRQENGLERQAATSTLGLVP
jgi:UDP-N-acetylmuramate dehydrogenase